MKKSSLGHRPLFDAAQAWDVPVGQSGIVSVSCRKKLHIPRFWIRKLLKLQKLSWRPRYLERRATKNAKERRAFFVRWRFTSRGFDPMRIRETGGTNHEVNQLNRIAQSEPVAEAHDRY